MKCMHLHDLALNTHGEYIGGKCMRLHAYQAGLIWILDCLIEMV